MLDLSEKVKNLYYVNIPTASMFFTIFHTVDNFKSIAKLTARRILQLYKDAIYITLGYDKAKQQAPHVHVIVMRRNVEYSKRMVAQMARFLEVDEKDVTGCPIWFALSNASKYIEAQTDTGVYKRFGVFDPRDAGVPWMNPLSVASGLPITDGLPKFSEYMWCAQGCPPYAFAGYFAHNMLVNQMQFKYIEFYKRQFFNMRPNNAGSLNSYYNRDPVINITNKEFSVDVFNKAREVCKQYTCFEPFLVSIALSTEFLKDKFSSYLCDPSCT